jgi:hypothetical protein
MSSDEVHKTRVEQILAQIYLEIKRGNDLTEENNRLLREVKNGLHNNRQ